MPSIDVAMRRSLSASALDLLAAAMRPVVPEVQPRDLITDTKGKITDVKTAFSSWDNCMKADFCKWPVIAIIVIGGLFIFSIVWCCARCLCCGVSCCCECFYCLKCCGNCCGCCDAPQKKHKYLDEPYIPPHQGYRMEAPMTAPMAGAAVGGMGAKSVHNAHNEAPQYAEFDMSKKGGEDALPEMPSWEGSGNKKIEVEQEAVELEQLNKPAANGLQPGQNVPLMTGTATTPGPVSPVSPLAQDPYGHPGSRQGSNAYLAGGAGADPYARQGPGYGASDGYGQSTSNLSMDQGHPGGMNQGYGMAAAGMAGGAMAGAAMGPNQRSPREYGGNGRYGTPPPMGQGYPGPRSSPGPGRQGSYDDYRRNGSGPPGAMPGFGSDSIQREPRLPDVMGGAYADKGPRRSPAPQGDQGYRGGYNRSPAPPYGPPQPQRQYSSDSTRPLARGPPQRQFSPAPVSPTALQNSGGFDFNSGYSRPSTSDNNNSFDQPRHASPQQQQQQQHTGGAGGGGSAYPGFKAYQPPSASNNSRPHENWSGL